jgi:hypothetical protein
MMEKNQSPLRDKNEDDTDRPSSNEKNKKRGMNFAKVGDRSI